ncbi:MAG: MFS transporter [Gemmatimonadaceae bacterium]
MNSATLQLMSAVSALTFALVTGFTSLLGLGPALSLISSALTSFPAGRLMDRIGRVPVIAAGFAVGTLGAVLTSLGAYRQSGWIAIAGFILIGAAGATGSLIRAAASDMYPASRRARGISYVMVGAVAGAILGPLVFEPIFRGRELSAPSLALPWLAGGGLLLIALIIVINVRPDPKRIAEIIEAETGQTPMRSGTSSTPLSELLRRPGVVPAIIVGVTSYAVMTSVMNLTGYVIVQHRHHPQHVIFPIIGAHVLGMYLLMPVVGSIVDRVGRPRALAAGLLILAASTAGLMWFESVVPIALLLFGLGLGWNVSFVAATTQLANLAGPSERGKLLGFNDLVANLAGALLLLLGGYILDDFGLTALALSISLIALAPLIIVFRPSLISVIPAAARQP